MQSNLLLAHTILNRKKATLATFKQVDLATQAEPVYYQKAKVVDDSSQTLSISDTPLTDEKTGWTVTARTD